MVDRFPAGIERPLGFARRFGIGLPDGLERLRGAGDVKQHFCTFGGLAATAQWARDVVAER